MEAYRRLSSAVEHPPCKRTVIGSIPIDGSKSLVAAPSLRRPLAILVPAIRKR